MAAEKLAAVLRQDKFAMRALLAVREAGPEDAYIAAGFIRNRYWDSLYATSANATGPRSVDADIDVVFFNSTKPEKEWDLQFEGALESRFPTGLWQVRNQARMHSFGNHPPFTSLSDALAHWAETATTVGARLLDTGELDFIAPFGFDDLYGHVLRITPRMKINDPAGFDRRLDEKKWQDRWPDLLVVRD